MTDIANAPKRIQVRHQCDEQAYAEAVQRFEAMGSIPKGPVRLAISDIVRAAAEGTGFSAVEILGRSREAPIVAVRSEVMLVAYENGYSQAQIGRALSGRDPSTVSTMIRNAKARNLRRAFTANFVDLAGYAACGGELAKGGA